MHALLALFGPKRGLRIELSGPLVVGRAPSAGLQLLDELVSREHCRFEPEPGGGLRVVDLDSHNGTFVNGDPVAGERALSAGDEVVIGDTLWVVDPDLDLRASTWGDTYLLAAPSLPTQARALATEPDGTAALDGLRAAAQALATATSAEDRAARLLDAAIELTSADGALLLRGDQAAGVPLRPVAGRAPDSLFPISPDLLRLAAERERAVFADQSRPAALRSGRALTAAGVDALLVAAARREGRTRGFLCAGATGRRAFSTRDASTVEALAALADLAGLFDPPGPPREAPATARAPEIEHVSLRPELRGTAATATAATPAHRTDDDPIAASAAFREVVSQARRLATVPTTVLLTGDSGTGKEAIARLLHRAGPRASGPFIAVNCGAVPETLAESELFGSERGAFTGATRSRAGHFEAADGGTLFLDEIGELPLLIQVKLLRVLEERAVVRVGGGPLRRVDVRVVAATHRDLDADVAAGRFRKDLLYRIDVVRLHLPPLRERPEDIAPLAAVLLERIARRLALPTPAPSISPEAARALAAHPFPGNVRELQNVLERVLVLRERDVRGPITAGEMKRALPSASAAPEADSPTGTSLSDKVASLERNEILAALRRARGVKSRAAEALGISRPTLDKKIADLGVDLFAGETA